LATELVLPASIVKRRNALPKEIRIKFWEQLERLVTDPSYPSLRNEKLEGLDQWAFSITMNYRAMYIRQKERIIITAVGTHKETLG
jgi:hypothetical protein